MIKELNKTQTIVMYFGGALMLIGLVVQLFMPQCKFYCSVAYLIGTISFTSMQMLQSYTGNSIRLQRLRRQQISSDVFLIISGIMMLLGFYTPYCRHLEWLCPFTIGVIQQLWTSIFIPSEMEKEDKKKRS